MITDPWVIWSYEHDAWWRQNRMGYTKQLLEAGVYSKTEADGIERNAEPGHEVALPLASALLFRVDGSLPARTVAAHMEIIMRHLV